ncbi:MAG: M20/M25/M40 family metallo-hydrolase [Chloroflexi bacterium]|nr:M20/M25/M40 family metallo-hydrolase [Chloroflexota bacterium]
MSGIDWQRMTDEAVGHLRALIRLNTTNPPGNELAAAKYLESILVNEGIQCQVLEAASGRGNLVARLHGSGEERPLLLLSHLDVVPADDSHWQRPPFGGELVDGFVWGRGALDCKFLVVLELMVMLLLKREGLPLTRDVVFAATADEETGGKYGLGWLGRNHRHLLECEYAINEGGGVGLLLGGRRYYVCQTAEKGVCWLRLRVRGEAGHASLPTQENPVLKLARVVDRLSRARLEMRVTPTAASFLRTFAQTQKFPARLLARGLLNRRLCPVCLPRMKVEKRIAGIVHAMLHDTATPTVVRAGELVNVVPTVAEVEVDCRLVPGQTREGFLERLRKVVGVDVEVEVALEAPGFESSHESPLYQTIADVLAEQDPGAALAPFMLTMGTDSKYLAAAGVQVYGFAPMKQEADASVLDMVHGHDERVSVENVGFGTKVLYEIVRRFCGQPR